MDLVAFVDLRAMGQRRIERGHRFLEDHRDFTAPDFLHLSRCFSKADLRLQRSVRLGDPRGGYGNEAQDREAPSRFCRAGFADDAKVSPPRLTRKDPGPPSTRALEVKIDREILISRSGGAILDFALIQLMPRLSVQANSSPREPRAVKPQPRLGLSRAKSQGRQRSEKNGVNRFKII